MPTLVNDVTPPPHPTTSFHRIRIWRFLTSLGEMGIASLLARLSPSPSARLLHKVAPVIFLTHAARAFLYRFPPEESVCVCVFERSKS